MQRVVSRLIVIVGFLVAALLGVERVQAVGCEVTDESYECFRDGVWQICQAWGNGDCGGIDNGGCPPNTHINPNGSCGDNGTGGRRRAFRRGRR